MAESVASTVRVGPATAAMNPEWLRMMKVSSVIQCLDTWPSKVARLTRDQLGDNPDAEGWDEERSLLAWRPKAEGIRFPSVCPYLTLRMTDFELQSIREALDTACAFARHHGGITLVHCAAGVSRSVTVACALLLDQGHAQTVDDALARIRKHRPRAQPNPLFEQQLRDWWAGVVGASCEDCDSSQSSPVSPTVSSASSSSSRLWPVLAEYRPYQPHHSSSSSSSHQPSSSLSLSDEPAARHQWTPGDPAPIQWTPWTEMVIARL